MLTSVLLTKLPPEMRLILSRRATGEALNLETLQTVFEEELVAREHSCTGQSKPVRYNQDTNSRLPPTATTLLLGSRLTGVSSCSYCQQSHSEADCSNVTTIDSRIQILKTAGRCFNCLTKGHVVRKCCSPPQCQTCRRKHHTSICDQSRSTGNTRTQSNHRTEQTSVTVSTLYPVSTLNPEAIPFSTKASTDSKVNAGVVLLQTARAIFYDPRNPERRVELRILLDSGSQRSYMTERARSLLSLKAEGKQSLSIATFGSSRGCPKTCRLVRVGVLLEGFPNLSLSLFVVPMICEPLIGQPIYECVEQNPHLIGLNLADDLHHSLPVEVDVLIGSDHYWDLVTGTVRMGDGGPTAIHSKLGWVLSGPTMVAEYTQSSINLVTTHVLRPDVDVPIADSIMEQLKVFWDLESMGINKGEEAKEEYPVEIEFVDGRYQVSLPWKQLSQSLPDNYLLSKRRLIGLLNRLRRLLHEYDRVIQEQIKQGIVEDVPTSVMDSSTCVHYLPHHGIVRRDKNTTRLSVVYDASARLNRNPSLNDCLMVGPKFNQKVLNILMRFRSHRIAITADIEKAFLMIAVTEEDRDALRFLWVKDINEDDIKLRPLRFTRVVFGVRSSPFLLNSTIRYHLERHRESYPQLVQKLVELFYVDDVVSGASTEEEAFKLYTDSKQILKKAAFNLRKFKTNSQLLQQRIDIAESLVSGKSSDDFIVPKQEKSNAMDNISAENASSVLKVLGVAWDPESDRLYFTISQVAEAAAAIEPTKRNVVRIIGKFYDPMGFLAPLIVPFKRFFQKLCENLMQWDAALPDTFREEWESLVRSLHGGGSYYPFPGVTSVKSMMKILVLILYMAFVMPQCLHTQQ